MATLRRDSLRMPLEDVAAEAQEEKKEEAPWGGLHFQAGPSSKHAQPIAASGALRLLTLSYIAWDACIVGEERTDLTRPAHSASL